MVTSQRLVRLKVSAELMSIPSLHTLVSVMPGLL
jgi:hypothetical protein